MKNIVFLLTFCLIVKANTLLEAPTFKVGQKVTFIDLSHDEEEMVVLTPTRILILQRNGLLYDELKQTLTSHPQPTFSAYSQNDNQLHVLFQQGKVVSYTRDNSGVFRASPDQVSTGSSEKSYALALNEDASKLVISHGSNIKKFLTNATGQYEDQNQDQSYGRRVEVLKYFGDYLMIMFKKVSSGSSVLIRNSTHQSSTSIVGDVQCKTRINDYPRFMVRPLTNSEIDYYSIDGITLTNAGSISVSVGQYTYSTISQNGSVMIVSGTTDTQVHQISGQVHQTQIPSTTNTMSQDMRNYYLGTESGDIYHFVNCENPEHTLDELGECVEYNSDNYVGNGRFLPCNLTNCLSCSDQSSCESCADGYYLSNSTCQFCNNSQDLFMNGDECQECSLENCIDCVSLQECASCDESYYLLNSTCHLCNSSLNQFLREGECVNCNITGCLNCSSLTECVECDEEEGFYQMDNICMFCNRALDSFIEEGNCTKCSLKGCLNCRSLSQCQECDEANNYFLQNSSCVICDLENCLECASLTECRRCDESYVLSEGQCVEDVGSSAALPAVLGTLTGVIVVGAVAYTIYNGNSGGENVMASQSQKQFQPL